MEQEQKNSTRKKFLLLGGALISAIAFSKYFNSAKKPNIITCGETTTVKMLTRQAGGGR
jgi:hypothetical protein